MNHAMTKKLRRIRIIRQSPEVMHRKAKSFLKVMVYQPLSKRKVDQEILFYLMKSWINCQSADFEILQVIIINNSVRQSYSKLYVQTREKGIERSEAISAIISEVAGQSWNECEDILEMKIDHKAKRKIQKKKKDKERKVISKSIFFVGLFLIFSLILSWPICKYFLNIEPSTGYVSVMGSVGFTLLALSVFGEKALNKFI